ncbi:MAG: TlyA family RNA methyltransferase [Chloroflexi bacterium]|nr:TlyA family RNA methyltransferase [Chloroflexota bacterium]
MGRLRLDTLLVERGFAATREKARSFILAGQVRVAGQVADKPGRLMAADALIALEEPPRYVGRGGIKLVHALDALHVDPRGLVALDIGASTGGFTDCLLQRGARRVYAIDVGYGQLDYRLRQDPRVVVLERVNARYPLSLPELADLATMDVSFISVTQVIPSVVHSLKPGSPLVTLVKPQFEVGKGKVGRGGVVRDTRLHAEVLSRCINWAIAHGLRLGGLTPSPILGDAGNREFFLLLRTEP